MNVARPHAVLSNRLDAEALMALARTTQPLTARQVSRLVPDGSERGVRLALQRLAKHGLVDSRPAGRADLYALNREHLAAPIVEQLAGLRSSLFDRVRSTIREWPVQPLHASIFGSAARGDGDIDSDIDLLVVRSPGTDEEDPAWREQVDGLVDTLRRWTGNQVSLAELSAEDARQLDSRERSVAGAIQADSVDLAGTPARRLVPRT
jgi:predicted nucleotidyltransferase